MAVSQQRSFSFLFVFRFSFSCLSRTVGVAFSVDMDSLLPSTVADLILACTHGHACLLESPSGLDKQSDHLTRQDKTRQDKTRQDKTRQDKTRQDKTRQTERSFDKTGSGQTEVFVSPLGVTFTSHFSSPHLPAHTRDRQPDKKVSSDIAIVSQSDRQTDRQTATAAPLAAAAAAAAAAAPLAAPPAVVVAAGAILRTGHRVGPGGDVREEHDAHIPAPANISSCKNG
eukprot:COSAG06_NODE_8688_length_2096_cov_13.278815_2_plen_228_part_00